MWKITGTIRNFTYTSVKPASSQLAISTFTVLQSPILEFLTQTHQNIIDVLKLLALHLRWQYPGPRCLPTTMCCWTMPSGLD